MPGRTGRWWAAGCVVVVAAAALMAASTAMAGSGGVGTVSFTQKIKNQVIESGPDINPCSGAPGTFTLFAVNAVFHVTFNANGFWATETAEGWASFTPNDSSQPSYFGRFTAWDGDNGNLRNGTETSTFHVHLQGSDGSVITAHDAEHMSFSANAINSVSFAHGRLTCG